MPFIDTLTDINFIIPMVFTILIIVSISILTLLWGTYWIDKLYKDNNEITKGSPLKGVFSKRYKV